MEPRVRQIGVDTQNGFTYGPANDFLLLLYATLDLRAMRRKVGNAVLGGGWVVGEEGACVCVCVCWCLCVGVRV